MYREMGTNIQHGQLVSSLDIHDIVHVLLHCSCCSKSYQHDHDDQSATHGALCTVCTNDIQYHDNSVNNDNTSMTV